MRIGEVAEAAGIATRTVRFYERRGLLPEPEREPNGYRRYDVGTPARLRFVRTAQAAGLTLAEIAGVLRVRDDGTAPCTHVGSLLETKLADVRRRRRQLAALERELEHLVERSRGLDPADCREDDVCTILAVASGDPPSGPAAPAVRTPRAGREPVRPVQGSASRRPRSR